MAFSPETFLSNIRAKDGPAKPSRFEVILPIPRYIGNFINNTFLEQLANLPNSIIADVTDAVNSALSNSAKEEQSKTSNASISRYLSLQCETAELPGKTFLTQDAKIYGPTFKVPYQVQYSDINLGFICTNDFYERKLFERWMEAIIPSDTNNLRYPKDNETRYMTNIKIIQFDDFIKQIYAVELIDAFPIGIASQPLSWSDDTFHRLSVQFAYQKYRVVYQGNYDLIGASLEYFGGRASRIWNARGQEFTNGIGNLIRDIF
jgi:hypothetical protein